MVTCLLDNIPINVSQFVISDIKHYKNRDSSMLIFPSFFTELCERAKVKEYSGDNWVSPIMPIFLLKIHCEGALSKGKSKRSTWVCCWMMTSTLEGHL